MLSTHLVFLSGEDMNHKPLIFRCECLCHKSVQFGKIVNHVHQKKSRGDVPAEQKHRDNDNQGRVSQLLVAADSFFLRFPGQDAFCSSPSLTEEVFRLVIMENGESLKS